MLIKCRLNTVFISLLSIHFSVLQSQDAVTITNQLFSTIKNIKTLKYTCESNERIEGKLRFESSNFKLQQNPFKIYVYQNLPSKGIECLFNTGENNNKAKINPNAFPWVSLNLQPENNLLLENRHHSIFDAGFAYTASLLEQLMKKYAKQLDKALTYNGVEVINGVSCYKITFTNPNYRITLYSATENENALSIAQKLKINFYTILDNNSGYKPTDSFKNGTRVIVTNDYASKMEMYIHTEKYYPVYIKVFDSKGLYEEYKFSKIEINPNLKDIDFSSKNPDYKFR